MLEYEKNRMPQVVFGSGSAGRAGAYLKRYEVKKCLVVSGAHISRHPVTKKALDGLSEQGIEYEMYAKVPAEPSDMICLEIAEIIKNGAFDCVLGIGGGSPMDAAKAALTISGIPERIEDLHDYGKSGTRMQENWQRPCMLVLLPTTSGSGAEATATAVISSQKHGLKFSFGNRNTPADLCIIDPDFTLGMPAGPTICGGMDAIAHSIEMLIGVGKNEYTRATVLSCLEKAWKWLPIAVAEPENRDAREQLSWAAHNALSNGGMANGHAVAHAIGSLYHLVHGHACAVVLPTLIRHFAQASQEQIREIAGRIGVPVTGEAKADAARVADAILAYYKALGLKPLREAMRENGFEEEEQVFLQKMVPAVLDDFKSQLWLPPIHTEDSWQKVAQVCLQIYREQ